MRRLALLAALAATLIGTTPASAADIGVTIEISQPGVYGRIDIGRFPQPAVVLVRPVIVAPAPVVVEPVYLWVPPGHRKNWRKHCHRYNACAVPVYFVRHDWYDEHVRYSGGGWGASKGEGKGKGKGKGRD